MPQGEGLGLAVLHIWDTCLAAVAHVKVGADKQISVPQVTVAVDCGVPVNPLGVRAQVEGGVTFALSAALYGGVTLDKGRIEQSNFHDVRALRMNEAPRGGSCDAHRQCAGRHGRTARRDHWPGGGQCAVCRDGQARALDSASGGVRGGLKGPGSVRGPPQPWRP
jgi:hypothetical protein